MKRVWFLLLTLSLGLNAGLLYTLLSPRSLAGSASQENLPEAAPPALDAPPHEGMPCATPGGAGPCEVLMHNRLDRMGEVLGLKGAQWTEVRGVLGEMLPRIMAERENVQQIRRRVHEEYMQPEVDAGLIRALVTDLAAAQARLDSLTAETILRESGLLTREQRLGYFRSMPWERCRDCPPPPRGERDRAGHGPRPR
ncbi:MAG: periplasmic heavy metal sensor [Candidatus Eisenbacteria bacterium]